MKSSLIGVVVLVVIVSLISSLATSFLITGQNVKTKDQLIKEFYDVENAVHVSPHGLRKHLSENLENVILVDLRSQEEYEEEHILGAVNVPAYKDRDRSDYGAVDRIVSSFQQLQKDNPEKEFIVYCYSMPCMTGRKIGQILADHGIYVKHLGIGWIEWRYHWELWNHPHEWNQTDVMDYIASGPEPGIISSNVTGGFCSIGGLGC